VILTPVLILLLDKPTAPIIPKDATLADVYLRCVLHGVNYNLLCDFVEVVIRHPFRVVGDNFDLVYLLQCNLVGKHKNSTETPLPGLEWEFRLGQWPILMSLWTDACVSVPWQAINLGTKKA